MNCLFKAEFPEITLCSEGGGYKSNILLENGFLSSSDYSGYKQIILHSFFVFLIGNYIYTIHQVKVLVILSYLILSYLILSFTSATGNHTWHSINTTVTPQVK